ncbi:futalosine hydrolase [Aneurinibacillus soli]|uniref:Futalosine hydrolase n=1 Tax=Aneurinibacillus soli TaxID=1500254 RepID=A0A0U5BAS2_9BACL|nr:futalosine hydrolase [Aneurinibacillus soli]PYE64047.1 futalosine hydrolase [Aneurinibacillus soli]BAU27996.1 Futalosine hydrolase [Aneurinibacillus soli]
MNVDRRTKSAQRILIMTSVSAERDAILRGLHGNSTFDVRVGGVGLASAAASTATALATTSYSLVINMGIAGGFVGQAEIGSLVVANEIIAADLGSQTPDGFISIDELGFGSARVPVDTRMVAQVVEALQAAGFPTTTGPILTVSTTTGTAATAQELAARVPGAAAEGMEGYGVATAAHQHGIPVLEIRAISNPVGPRDRDAWRIKEALQMLESASSVLLEVLS